MFKGYTWRRELIFAMKKKVDRVILTRRNLLAKMLLEDQAPGP